MSNVEPALLSRKETMALLGVSYDTFRKLLGQGVVRPGIQLGGRMRWSKDAVIKHLDARVEAQRAAHREAQRTAA